MRFAILIITYTSARQTKRLVDALNNGSFDFYIHVDKKLDLNTHKELFDIPNVYFIENRVDIKWAGFSTVEAALNGIRQITASNNKYEFINLITGQDYPIKSAEYIEKFLKDNIGKEFILYKDFETEWSEANERVTKYHFTEMTFKGHSRLEKIVNMFTGKRKFPLDVRLYGKETFWTLSMQCAQYVVNVIDSNSQLKNFLRYTWGSDEFIFQTIIMASPFKDNVINKNYRYIDWPPGEARPKVLLSEDFDKIMASDSIFARKLDINKDEQLFDMLDKANNVIN
ncbi:beta-1,6-N-acetylglucosaminyltransferase [Mucilaginibacter corticis]|uniref:Peptide O-xylosyltransferase n=1 Tax=Mucilaginibacter corticis TaxID=2597670 RepID=A0A556MLD2_9SPHI|nr:beta-1,6-N-acetylglucosaminyltransferase [Mucilaginibacter corticis]TSJ40737.1 beta-1,6-N-acetylglucosaminyltransferase [Mucilaginibacter corticis]